MMTPTEVLKAGYYQVSAKYRHVARLPPGETGVVALANASRRPEWAARLGEEQAGDHYLRVYSRDVLTLSLEDWWEFKRLGGGTYRRWAELDKPRRKSA